MAKKLTKNETIALIGLGLVAISPWHILQSIWSLDCNMFPHFLLLAIDLLYTGVIKNKSKILYISMFVFAITLYCYGVAIYFVPVFLFILSIYLLKNKIVGMKEIIICAVIFTLFAMPIVTMFAINFLHIEKSIYIGKITIPYYKGFSRTGDMIFFVPHKLNQFFQNIWYTIKVVFCQNDGAEWNAPKLFGTTYHITMLFVVIGFIKTMINRRKEKKDISSFLMILWILISLLTGIIVNKTNINRLNSIWYGLLLLAAIGIYEIYQRVKCQKIYKIAVTIMYIAIFLSFSIYFYNYYTQMIDQSGCFSRGFYQAISSVNTLDKQVIWYDNIKNDGCLELYLNLNHDNRKEYRSISEEIQLKEKIKNLGEEEALIIDVEFKQYGKTEQSYQIGDFLICP